eukprot:895394-Rhodomonas_salina.1
MPIDFELVGDQQVVPRPVASYYVRRSSIPVAPCPYPATCPVATYPYPTIFAHPARSTLPVSYNTPRINIPVSYDIPVAKSADSHFLLFQVLTGTQSVTQNVRESWRMVMGKRTSGTSFRSARAQVSRGLGSRV